MTDVFYVDKIYINLVGVREKNCAWVFDMKKNTFTSTYSFTPINFPRPNAYSITTGYKMSWFNKDDEGKGDRRGSGIYIDQDLYDRLNRINDTDKNDDRGVIEVPASSETVIYESPEGDTYEIPISDLIDADDDHEIEYESAANKHLNIFRTNYKATPKYKFNPMIMYHEKFMRLR